ncbi:hypothetical protein M2323_004425 [Rhodoblastus acidophilus]|uniref:hypothetical protein n=1 Tax=Rhodoblastus acidophilus TaxID=1074 RepID=UPI0022240823|nr:hypothetical protein [Rhodoblastus acidophilus]MCW2286612.1 hypothetical protein [Rhodoblastus acidophilus]MCW2335476.1 hypothetical protein [Rhodoblastus acidophilus]
MAQATQEQETAITVHRGLFLLRYATGAANGRSPFAVVRPAPASAPFIEVISPPGVVAGFLSAPGDFAIVRAEQSGNLIVKIVAQVPGDPLEASLRMEPLSSVEKTAPAAAAVAPTQQGAPAIPAQPAIFAQPTILAHVSRLGDVEVAMGAWIAGPDAPAPIEGLEVRGALPGGVAIELQPLLATNPPRWMDWSGPGGFVGTRRRALPLAGLRLRLTGASAENFEIAASGLFLGSPVQNRRGRELEFVSPAGVDPLVGLQVELVSASVVGVGANERTLAESSPESKLKVFRAMASA